MNEQFLKERTKEELIEMLVNETDATRELLYRWSKLTKWLRDKAMFFGYYRYDEVMAKMEELENEQNENNDN